MSNPRTTIYPVTVGCYINGKYTPFGKDFVTDDVNFAAKEVDRLVKALQTAYARNDYSEESSFINAHIGQLDNIFVDMYEITPNGESTHLKRVKVFTKGASRHIYY